MEKGNSKEKSTSLEKNSQVADIARQEESNRSAIMAYVQFVSDWMGVLPFFIFFCHVFEFDVNQSSTGECICFLTSNSSFVYTVYRC